MHRLKCNALYRPYWGSQVAGHWPTLSEDGLLWIDPHLSDRNLKKAFSVISFWAVSKIAARCLLLWFAKRIIEYSVWIYRVIITMKMGPCCKATKVILAIKTKMIRNHVQSSSSFQFPTIWAAASFGALWPRCSWPSNPGPSPYALLSWTAIRNAHWTQPQRMVVCIP